MKLLWYFHFIARNRYLIKIIAIWRMVKKSPPSYLNSAHNLITFNRNFLLEVNRPNYVHIISCTAIMIKPYMIINVNIGHICTFYCVWQEVNKLQNEICHDLASLLTFVGGFPYAFVIIFFIIENYKLIGELIYFYYYVNTNLIHFIVWQNIHMEWFQLHIQFLVEFKTWILEALRKLDKNPILVLSYFHCHK